jgi:hypothetical protein
MVFFAQRYVTCQTKMLPPGKAGQTRLVPEQTPSLSAPEGLRDDILTTPLSLAFDFVPSRSAIPVHPAPAPRVLFQDGFAGGYAQNWVGIQAAGGDFAKFATTTTGEVVVDVPANDSWGKTGDNLEKAQLGDLGERGAIVVYGLDSIRLDRTSQPRPPRSKNRASGRFSRQ